MSSNASALEKAQEDRDHFRLLAAMEAAAAAAAEPLSADVHAAPREACGFAGKPDELSGSYWTDSTPIPAQGMRQKADASKKDSKSAVAQAFSESLGLRN